MTASLAVVLRVCARALNFILLHRDDIPGEALELPPSRAAPRVEEAQGHEKTGDLNTQHHVKLAAVRSGLYRELHRIIENFIVIVHTFYYDRPLHVTQANCVSLR